MPELPHPSCLLSWAFLSNEQQGSTRAFELKSLTNLLASKKVRCGDSSYSPKLNGFSRSKASFKTCFESDVNPQGISISTVPTKSVQGMETSNVCLLSSTREELILNFVEIEPFYGY